MDLLRGDVKKTYFKYLTAAFGSAMLASVYGLVDMAMVGQYQGPQGAAALAVAAPVWNIIYSLGLLTGIGGSVLYGAARGTGDREKANRAFTVSLGMTALLGCLCWLGLALFDRQLLTAFGGDEALLPLARAYFAPVKFAVPAFLFTQMLAAFLRNDGRPALATGAVISGGVFNVFGDYFFVFVLDMGILGAGLATTLGAVITCLVLCSHFFTKGNTLRLVPVTGWLGEMGRIGVTGFSAFFADLAMGILTVLFNRQIMAYLGADALAVYGVLVNLTTLVQCCAYSVGQAAQPILSLNYGARQGARIRRTLGYALYTVAAFGLFWTAVLAALPTQLIHLFMDATPGVLAAAPAILRTYGLAFLLLPLNVFSGYYFQSILQPGMAFGVSVARGLVVSGGLILLLPPLAGGAAVWLALPITELVIALAVAAGIRRSARRLREGDFS